MPKIIDHEAHRDMLAAACFRLFAECGYAATSMRQIARALEVSTGTLYHYFPDKSSILAHMFEAVVREDVSRFDQLVMPDATLEMRVTVTLSYVRARKDHLRDVLRLALEVHRHEPSGESHAQVRRAMFRYRTALGAALGLEDGAVARAAFSLVVGELVHDLLDPGHLDEDRQASALLGLCRAAR
jgi:AcrR family transcriptional regulator